MCEVCVCVIGKCDMGRWEVGVEETWVGLYEVDMCVRCDMYAKWVYVRHM